MRALALLLVMLAGCSPSSSSSTPSSTAAPTTVAPLSTATPPPPVPVLRVLTYNLWTSFFTPAPDPRWRERLDHAAREVALLGPLDAIALQEVSRCDLGLPPLLARENTAALLARALGHGVAFTPTLPLLPVYEEGNAITSPWPIRVEEELWLPSSPPHPRRALLVELDTPHGPLRVVCLHLSGSEEHARAVVAWLASQRPMPTLALGDVNAEPHEAAVDVLRAAGWVDAWDAATGGAPGGFTADPRNANHAPTDPAQRIDYVFTLPGPRALRARSARVVLDAPDATGKPASDHFGLLVEIELP
jgi:endonuclease/exonuclease/phosphatase family metal-dependent hydrolase